ncbi:MAG: adenylyltransferase/cytidyltransferase family protein [Flavobacteriales bacterium]|nr:adenylyltransferase/cytidyltransferase family protein [Flavobacteriales bacterium]
MQRLKTTDQIARWKKQGDKIVFTNGVFDILHVGHVHYLSEARKLGDKLVIGLNSDESVRLLNKAPDRPINPQEARKTVLEALRCVDAVIIFGDPTPLDLIKSIQPGILVKGGDYDPQQTDANHKAYIVGSQEVRANGGEVIAIPTVEGFSTTETLRKLKQ